MANPEVVEIPEWTWVKVATAIKKIHMSRLITNVYYYRTYRLTGEDAPTTPTAGELPEEAVRLFDITHDEFIESSQAIDVYIMCSNSDDDSNETGKIYIGPDSSSIDTVRQSNTSPWNDFYFVQANGESTTLTAAVPTAGDTRELTVASIANISIGDWLGVFDSNTERYYWAEVMDINGLVLTMQTLIDYTFPIGSTVLSTTKNMAVDGSVTPQVFGIQAGRSGGTLAIDISRIMMASLTNDAVNLDKFADIAGGLTYGIYFRVKENGVYRNKMIARKNFDLAKFAYDWDPYQSINPQQGQDGFAWRFSLGGEDKHDTVSRVQGGNIGTLECVIQDDLSTIVLLEAVGANSEVTQ